MTEGVSAVSLKLPTFWAEQPAVWFTQTEAQFHIRHITDDATKYYYVVASLNQATASRLLDTLAAPPETNKYEGLKQRLLQTFGLNRRDRAAKLLHMQGLGDRKPSALMDEMLALMDGHHPCLLFEQIYLEQLPEDIRLQLANEDFSKPRSLALRADALWQAKGYCSPSINKIASGHKNPTATDTPTTGWCFYHAKFGKEAKKCKLPCTFPGNDQAGRQ